MTGYSCIGFAKLPSAFCQLEQPKAILRIRFQGLCVRSSMLSAFTDISDFIPLVLLFCLQDQECPEVFLAYFADTSLVLDFAL